MMAILVYWKSNLCLFCQEELDKTLHLLQYNHPEMADTFKEDANNIRILLDSIDIDPVILM